MDLSGKNVLILGLGRSGLAAARLVRDRGGVPWLSDAAPVDRLAQAVAECAREGFTCETGGHSDDFVGRADLVVVSPGISAAVPPVARSRERGVPVLGELELASRFVDDPILAVTGTNGKTTVTELVAAVLRHAGKRVALAGNNDTPLSAHVLSGAAADLVVLEVSSYQLETVETLHPAVSAVLNLSPDHLARHGAMEEYGAAKARIMARQGAGDVAVLNADDPQVAAMRPPEGVRTRHFSMNGPVDDGFWWDGRALCNASGPVLETDRLRIPGRHNIANALAALTMVESLGLPLAALCEGVAAFPGVPHRIEYVCTRDGVAYYNDSKSTNVDSLRVALESFDAPVVLIAGGQGKGAPYDSVLPLVRERVRLLIAIGDEAPRLAEAFQGAAEVVEAGTMDRAVALARSRAALGDVVLLSPACASFDAYSGFEERGGHFKACVLASDDSTASGGKEVPCERK